MLVAEDDFHCSHMANLFKTQNCSLILQSGSFVHLGYTLSSIVLLIAQVVCCSCTEASEAQFSPDSTKATNKEPSFKQSRSKGHFSNSRIS